MLRNFSEDRLSSFYWDVDPNIFKLFWKPWIRAVPIRIPDSKQKQCSISGMFFRISFIPNHFNRNRSRNRFVPVTIESVNICDQNVIKPVLLKKLLKKQRNKFGHKSKFVTVCDVTNATTWSQMVSPVAAAGEGWEVRGGRRGESAEGECDRSQCWSRRRQRSREGAAVIEVLRISPRGWSKSPSSASFGRGWASLGEVDWVRVSLGELGWVRASWSEVGRVRTTMGKPERVWASLGELERVWAS